MGRSSDFIQYGIECLRSADTATNAKDRDAFFRMAEAWSRAAVNASNPAPAATPFSRAVH